MINLQNGCHENLQIKATSAISFEYLFSMKIITYQELETDLKPE